MKVMFNPSSSTAGSSCVTSSAVKQAGIEIPRKAEGYSNEEIYNAIMKVKNSITKMFTKSNSHQAKHINTLA